MKNFVSLLFMLLLLTAPCYGTTLSEQLPASLGAVSLVVPSTVNPGVLYAGSQAGFFVSVDQGRNWEKRADGNHQYLIVSDSLPEVIISAADGRAFRISEDGGTHWKEYLLMASIYAAEASVTGCFEPGSSNQFYIATDQRILSVTKSDDGWNNPVAICVTNQQPISKMFMDEINLNRLHILSPTDGWFVLQHDAGVWTNIGSPVTTPTFETFGTVSYDAARENVYVSLNNNEIHHLNIPSQQ